jgi:hypothetical protein
LIQQTPIFDPDQFGVLEEFFDLCPYPNPAEIEFFAHALGVAENIIEHYCKQTPRWSSQKADSK